MFIHCQILHTTDIKVVIICPSSLSLVILFWPAKWWNQISSLSSTCSVYKLADLRHKFLAMHHQPYDPSLSLAVTLRHSDLPGCLSDAFRCSQVHLMSHCHIRTSTCLSLSTFSTCCCLNLKKPELAMDRAQLISRISERVWGMLLYGYHTYLTQRSTVVTERERTNEWE